MSKLVSHTLKESDLLTARERFREQESRDLFYRAATELVRLALDGQTSIQLRKLWVRCCRLGTNPSIVSMESLTKLIFKRLKGWWGRVREVATMARSIN